MSYKAFKYVATNEDQMRYSGLLLVENKESLEEILESKKLTLVQSVLLTQTQLYNSELLLAFQRLYGYLERLEIQKNLSFLTSSFIGHLLIIYALATSSQEVLTQGQINFIRMLLRINQPQREIENRINLLKEEYSLEDLIQFQPEYVKYFSDHLDLDNNLLDSIWLTFETMGSQVVLLNTSINEEDIHCLNNHIQMLYNELHHIGSKKSGDFSSKGKGKKKSRDSEHKEPLPDYETCLIQLQQMIGLDSVKKEVKTLTNLVRVNQMRKDRQMPVVSGAHHLVFLGNPGTGKTTIARMISKIYHSLGMLSKGHLIETERSRLVAGYVGQTAQQVQEVVEEALGGILFIDEAYSLVSSRHEHDFGYEAVDTLIKLMEDHREDLIVIVAGYPDKMHEFIKANPGLQSRFNKYISFPDYNSQELINIFLLMCQKNQYMVTQIIEDYMIGAFDKIIKDASDSFGNGRTVRNIFEKAIEFHANRVIEIEEPNDEDLSEFCLNDIKEAFSSVKQ